MRCLSSLSAELPCCQQTKPHFLSGEHVYTPSTCTQSDFVAPATIDLAYCSGSNSDMAYFVGQQCCSDGKSICDDIVGEKICASQGDFSPTVPMKYCCQQRFLTTLESAEEICATIAGGGVNQEHVPGQDPTWQCSHCDWQITEAECAALFRGKYGSPLLQD